MNEKEQKKMALRKAVNVLSETIVKNKYQDRDYYGKEKFIESMTQSLHKAIYVIIRCTLGVKHSAFINYDRVPKAIAVANKVSKIILEGV